MSPGCSHHYWKTQRWSVVHYYLYLRRKKPINSTSIYWAGTGQVSLSACQTISKVTSSRKLNSEGEGTVCSVKMLCQAVLQWPLPARPQAVPRRVNTSTHSGPSTPPPRDRDPIPNALPLSGRSWRPVKSASAPGPLLSFLPLVATVICLSLAPGPWLFNCAHAEAHSTSLPRCARHLKLNM